MTYFTVCVQAFSNYRRTWHEETWIYYATSIWPGKHLFWARVHLFKFLTAYFIPVSSCKSLLVIEQPIRSCDIFIFWAYRALIPVLHWMATYEFMVGVCVDVLPPLTSVQLLQLLPRLEILLRNFHARFVGSKWMPTNVYISLKGRHKVNFSFIFMPGVPLGLRPNLT